MLVSKGAGLAFAGWGFDSTTRRFYAIPVLNSLRGDDLMTITKWEPIKDLITLQDRMNRLFD